MKVLIVDDNPLLLHTRKLILQHMGYEVVPAEDAASALSAVAANEFAVAVVDYNLPDMDGEKLCDEIKRMKSGMPIILASGSVPDDVECSDYFFLKGASPGELIDTIKMATQKAA